MPTTKELIDILENENVFIACIAEGTLDEQIIEYLLDENRLIFTRDKLLEGKVLRCRKGENFCKNYLGKSMGKKVIPLRILDSPNERFNIPQAYKRRFFEDPDFPTTQTPLIINAVTQPEIEILLVINEGEYQQFKKFYNRNKGKNAKPSIFVKQELNLPDCKDQGFCRNYFKDVDNLVDAIAEYKRINGNEFFTIFDLLKMK